MTFTQAGNKKLAARLKAKHGVDENGKSIHHQRAGSAGGRTSPSNFKRLTETAEGRAKLVRIALKGAAASNAVQNQRRRAGDETTPASER